jgi:hypothetical protein
MKTLKIDFLYLDLNTCERCMATDSILQEALAELSGVLNTLGYTVQVNKVNITTRELAAQYRFLSSPTIRINNIDICGKVTENNCCSCGEICGDGVDCRTFTYDGETYEQPTKAMLIDGILRAIYGQLPQSECPYTLPDNLERFFAGRDSQINLMKEGISMKTISIYEPAMCCETGVCGVGVDPELLRISTALSNLKKYGVVVNRYNLSNAPQEFIKNKEINKLIMGDGVESLPATVIDGKIVMTKKYPSNDEIAELLSVPKSYLGEEKKTKGSGCCCGDGGCC